jgi:hypothetical protein
MSRLAASVRMPAAVALVVLSAVACTTTPAPLPTSPAGQTVGPSGAISSPGSSATAAGPIAQKSACELIFKDEASAAIGVSIEAPQEIAANSDEGGWLSDCAYWRHGFFDQAPMDVTLASGATYLARFEDIRAEDGVSSIPGVGDEALFRLSTISGLDGPIGALFVRAGDAVIGLSLGIVDLTDSGGMVLAGDADKQQQILVDLAGIAVRRLTSPAPEAASICALIGLDQAAGIVGLPLSAAEDLDNHDAWGPSCQYKGSDGTPELFVSVNSRPTGQQNFETCKANGETVLGVGEDAFYDISACPIQVAYQYIGNPLMARSGDTVIAVGEAGKLESQKSREVIKAVARLVLEKLGFDPGTTPRPIAADALVHPCSLVSEAEVSSAVGVAIASHTEWSAQEGVEALCYYLTADNAQPLHLRLGTGQSVVREFSDYTRYGAGYTPVDGVGDEALQFQSAGEADQPLVSLYVRSGETVLELYLGGNGESADTFKLIAPGTPAEQLEILRGLAQLILPRLYAPNTTPSPSPNSGASLSLHVRATYPGGSFEADGHCDLGPDDSWIYLGFQRGSQPEEYLTVGPAPNGIGGSSPKGGGVFGADSVQIAVYDSSSGALLFAENPRAILPADLRSGSFNGLWKGASIDFVYTCQ